MDNKNIKQKESNCEFNLYLEFSNRTSPINFCWDTWFHYVMWSAVYLLIFRIFFTFVFAFAFSEQWYVEKLFGWFPIIAFNSEMTVFTKMNSYSLLATSLTVFLIFLFYLFSKFSIDKAYKIYAWYLAVIMTFVQYLVLIFVNSFIQFSIYANLWIVFIFLIILASILLYLWKKYLFDYQIRKIVNSFK